MGKSLTDFRAHVNIFSEHVSGEVERPILKYRDP